MAGLKQGEFFEDFLIVEAREPRHIRKWDGSEETVPGYFELSRELPGGGYVRFSASSGPKVLRQAVSWIKDQSVRKDGGHLTAKSGPKIKVVEHSPPPEEPAPHRVTLKRTGGVK